MRAGGMTPMLRSLLLSWMLVLLVAFAALLFVRLRSRRRGKRNLLFAAVILLLWGAYQRQLYGAGTAGAGGVTAVCLMALTAGLTAALREERRWRKAHITPASIKEGMDNLPAGLCYYWPGGLPKLVNRRMEELCRALTGGALTDGEAFCRCLAERAQGEQSGLPVVTLTDGRAFSFRREEIRLDGEPMVELMAWDVSEEVRRGIGLARKQREAEAVNARLKALPVQLKYLVMERESLQTKIRIHDSFGQQLLKTSRAVTEGDTGSVTALLEGWRQSIELLQHGQNEGWQQPYFIVKKQLAAMGVELVTEGELPQEAARIPVVETALITQATNVLRHAGGRKIFAQTTETDTERILVLTNDGTPPVGEVRETGGLANLRAQAEAAGGFMEVQSRPVFALKLGWPKEISNGSNGTDRR